jgi:hypothetical protein
MQISNSGHESNRASPTTMFWSKLSSGSGFSTPDRSNAVSCFAIKSVMRAISIAKESTSMP